MTETTPRLLLIRHGRSSHVHRDGWIDAAGMERWRAAYDAAGITPAEVPPPEVVADVARTGAVVASDMPRAIGSARMLAPDRDVVVTPLMRETKPPVPHWLPLQMPPDGWRLVMGALWGLRILSGTEAPTDEMARAATAADWLTRLASEHGSVAVVTHGAFRRLVSRRLIDMGWRAEPRRRGYDHWSVWAFVATPSTSGPIPPPR